MKCWSFAILAFLVVAPSYADHEESLSSSPSPPGDYYGPDYYESPSDCVYYCGPKCTEDKRIDFSDFRPGGPVSPDALVAYGIQRITCETPDGLCVLEDGQIKSDTNGRISVLLDSWYTGYDVSIGIESNTPETVAFDAYWVNNEIGLPPSRFDESTTGVSSFPSELSFHVSADFGAGIWGFFIPPQSGVSLNGFFLDCIKGDDDDGGVGGDPHFSRWRTARKDSL